MRSVNNTTKEKKMTVIEIDRETQEWVVVELTDDELEAFYDMEPDCGE